MCKDIHFLVYRIWYGNRIVYVGRTKQSLQNRIRGHLFHQPYHKPIEYEKVTKIEYAELASEADMNLYEIFFILRWHPELNIDDKAPDDLTVSLPEIQWNEWTTHLWNKWGEALNVKQKKTEKLNQQAIRRQSTLLQLESRLSQLKHRRYIEHEISDEQFQKEKEELSAQILKIRTEIIKARKK